MTSMTVSVVYQSGAGHTRRLAEAVAAGCRQVRGTELHLLEIVANDIQEGRWSNDAMLATLGRSDAIVFGCATYMGSASSIFKSFLEKAFDQWTVQAWKDKVGGAFTNSASQSGDKLSTLIQLAIFGAQMGMLWVGVGDGPGNNQSSGSVDDINRLGSFIGLMSQSNGDQGPEFAPSRGDLATAERFGKRIADVTGKYLGRTDYVTKRDKLT